MDKKLFLRFMDKIRPFNDKEYLFALVSYHIAPTMAGCKPSSIVTFGKSERQLNILWEKYKDCFRENFELDFYELRKDSRSTTVLFYDQLLLNEIVFNENNINYLKGFNYCESMELREALEYLSVRFKYTCPHEIGIFLGFPLEDVKIFIETPDAPCMLCGYWKVYRNPREAILRFAAFDKAKSQVVSKLIYSQ